MLSEMYHQTAFSKQPFPVVKTALTMQPSNGFFRELPSSRDGHKGVNSRKGLVQICLGKWMIFRFHLNFLGENHQVSPSNQLITRRLGELPTPPSISTCGIGLRQLLQLLGNLGLCSPPIQLPTVWWVKKKLRGLEKIGRLDLMQTSKTSV